MAWDLAGVTIHPGDADDQGHAEAFYAIQQILDATSETISWYAAGSERKDLKFVLDEDENSNSGLDTLKTARATNSDVTLSSDQGSQGSWRILDLRWSRRQDHSHSNPVYDCQAELIKV